MSKILFSTNIHTSNTQTFQIFTLSFTLRLKCQSQSRSIEEKYGVKALKVKKNVKFFMNYNLNPEDKILETKRNRYNRRFITSSIRHFIRAVSGDCAILCVTEKKYVGGGQRRSSLALQNTYIYNNWWIPTHALFHIQHGVSLECWF